MKNVATYSNLDQANFHIRSNSIDQKNIKKIENKRIFNEIKEIISQCKISTIIKEHNIKNIEGKEFVVCFIF